MNSQQLLSLASLFLSTASKSEKLSSLLDHIDQLDSFKDRIKLAEKSFKHLSSGSSRIVFLTDQNTVIKLAKNEKGIAQNKAESKHKKSKYINNPINYSNKFLWIQVPLLEKINNKEFEELTHLNFNDFSKSIDHYFKSSKSKPDNYKEICKSDFFKDITNLIEKFKLAYGDISRISSWGHKNNKPILIDTGLTNSVYQRYYKS